MTPAHKCDRAEEINEISKILALNAQTNMNLEKSIKELKQDIKEGFAKQEEKFLLQEKKFAWKWVEKILIFIGSIIGSSLVIALLALVIKK